MELRHVRYFVAVAEELNFRRAASRLNMAQPPLSQQIQKLERELGTTLLDRSKRHITLTKAGEAFLLEAYKVLDDVDRSVAMARLAAEGMTGRFSIGCVSGALYELVPGVIPIFRSRYPNIKLSIREIDSIEAIGEITMSRIDIALVRWTCANPGVDVIPLRREPLVVALPAGHPLTLGESVDIRQLVSEDIVAFPRALSPEYHDVIISVCRGAGFSPRIMYEVGSILNMIAICGSGLAAAFVPASACRMPIRGVEYRALSSTSLVTDISAIYRSGDDNPAIQNLLRLIANHLRVGPRVIDARAEINDAHAQEPIAGVSQIRDRARFIDSPGADITGTESSEGR